MATEFPVLVKVTLEPVWHDDPPVVDIGIDTTQRRVLTNIETFEYRFPGRGAHELIVTLINKQDRDTVPELGLDKQVFIRKIEFFGISDPKFIWAGKYRPNYPEPWYSQQPNKPLPVLTGQDCLSWNGTWSLEFTTPVFTWMHQTLNLGWIYD